MLGIPGLDIVFYRCESKITWNQSWVCFRLANKQDKVNALPGSELIELLSLEKLVNQSRSMCHIVSIQLNNSSYVDVKYRLLENYRTDADIQTGPSLFLLGILFSVNGPSALVWQKSSTWSALASAYCVPGFSWALYPCWPGLQDSFGNQGEAENQKNRKGKNREMSQKDQVWMDQTFKPDQWLFPSLFETFVCYFFLL